MFHAVLVLCRNENETDISITWQAESVFRNFKAQMSLITILLLLVGNHFYHFYLKIHVDTRIEDAISTQS